MPDPASDDDLPDRPSHLPLEGIVSRCQTRPASILCAMPILVTVSVDLAESVTLRDLRQFVEAAERNGADPEVDLREYDDNNDLVGLAAVGELESGESDGEDEDDGEDERPAAADEFSRPS